MPITSAGGCGCDETGSGCAPIASTGLCLVDGTPIAVVMEGPCPPATIPSALGWIDLTTGVFSAGNPPPGTGACGERFQFELGGLLCDVAGGVVVGVAILQIEYDSETGAVIGTSLIDAVTGAPYIPVGVMQVCGGSEIAQAVFCDIGAGNVSFLRRWVLTASGTTASVLDFDLDGATPYVVVGPIDSDCPCPSVAASVEMHAEVITGGPSTFVLPAGNVLSLTVMARDVAAPGSVTITTVDGTFDVKDAEVFTWSVTREQDGALLGPFQVDTTGVGDEILVLWTVGV